MRLALSKGQAWRACARYVATSRGQAMGHSNGLWLSVAIVIGAGADCAVLRDAMVITGGLRSGTEPSGPSKKLQLMSQECSEDNPSLGSKGYSPLCISSWIGCAPFVI